MVVDENNSYSKGDVTPETEDSENESKDKILKQPKTQKRTKQRMCLKTKGRKKQNRKFSAFRGFSEVGSKFVEIKHQIKREKSRNQVRLADRAERA